MRYMLFIGTLLALFTTTAQGEVVQLEITERVAYADGRAFDGVG